MPPRNRYLDSVIPNIYQRQAIDLLAFAFIDAYRFAQPTVTLNEAALAFVKRYNIPEHLYSVESVVTTYGRVNKDFNDAQKTENQGTR